MFLLQLLPLLLAVSAETQEEVEEVAVTEYSTTFLNVSWVDPELQVAARITEYPWNPWRRSPGTSLNPR